jgi:predicted ATP-grasp superfamily ATP-dependent carboligase
VVIVRGVEPQLRWRGFCQAVLGVADELKVELVLTLGALLADVPHTRPVPILGTTVEPSLARQFGLELARYEGPTGIVGVLHDACARAGRLAAGYWASVPHYVHQVSSPKAALALVEAVGRLVGARIDTGELRLGAEAYDVEVNQRVADDEDAAAYVAQLEEAADRARAEEAERAASSPLASGDQLAAEAERFLRNHNLE